MIRAFLILEGALLSLWALAAGTFTVAACLLTGPRYLYLTLLPMALGLFGGLLVHAAQGERREWLYPMLGLLVAACGYLHWWPLLGLNLAALAGLLARRPAPAAVD